MTITQKPVLNRRKAVFFGKTARFGKKYALVCFYLLFCLPIFAQNSVLSEGKNFKIGVTKTGIYRLDAAYLRQLGVDLANLNPKNLRLFGYGGAMLPQPNATPRPADLTENAVLVKGEADGRFDEGDALWFFGQSPHEIRFNASEKTLEHQLNLYSDTTFYFLQIGNNAGDRKSTRLNSSHVSQSRMPSSA